MLWDIGWDAMGGMDWKIWVLEFRPVQTDLFGYSKNTRKMSPESANVGPVNIKDNLKD